MPVSSQTFLEFQSTLPAGEATKECQRYSQSQAISIHASRGGSDSTFPFMSLWMYTFQSTLPAGEATQSACPSSCAQTFQSTLPAGEATQIHLLPLHLMQISIHASRGGSDYTAYETYKEDYIFQSTLPAGEATKIWFKLWPYVFISIHASRGGSDILRASFSASGDNFNPRFPRGKRPGSFSTSSVISISIHASRGGSDTTSARL